MILVFFLFHIQIYSKHNIIIKRILIVFDLVDVQYSVVIDAGSTGNRGTAYKFHIDRKSKQFILDDGEQYVKVHGGLGTFEPLEVNS